MANKIFIASATAAFFAALVKAQSAPTWNLFPTACSTDCAQTVEIAYLCETQYTTGTEQYGCFCEAYPSDAATCVTCLNSNDAAALATLLTSTETDCPAQVKACAFACAFDTCDSTDIACQCGSTYLENIYNCGSCNTANGNSGTQLTDFQSLNASCGAQSYTGAFQDYSTFIESPTGQADYVSVTLTATGGGDAATGTFAAATDTAAASSAATSAAASAAASGTTAAGSSGAAVVSASAAASGSASAAASAAASASASSSGASVIGVPVAIVAIAAVAAALF